MKSQVVMFYTVVIMSRPARGAWVEILTVLPSILCNIKSRPARGAWVEIHSPLAILLMLVRRAPQGARGLK